MYLEVLYHTIMPRGIELSCPMASNFDGLGFDSILDWFVVSCQSAVRSVTARAPWAALLLYYLFAVRSGPACQPVFAGLYGTLIQVYYTVRSTIEYYVHVATRSYVPS